MKTKIKISTPSGQAKGTEKKIKKFIIGFRKVKVNTYVNDEDNELYWEIEGSVRNIMKINKNVFYFTQMIQGVLDNKLMKKTLRKKLKPEQEEQLKNMLLNQTSCEIIKEATAEELNEYGKSFWTRMKDKFKKSEETQ